MFSHSHYTLSRHANSKDLTNQPDSSAIFFLLEAIRDIAPNEEG